MVVFYYAEGKLMHAWLGKGKRRVSICSPSLARNLTFYGHHSIIVKEEPELLNFWSNENHLEEPRNSQIMSKVLI